MKAKTKVFFEDLALVLIVGVIIYYGYNYFFPSNENNQEITQQTTVEKPIDTNENKEAVTSNQEIKKEEVIEKVEETPADATPIEQLKEDSIRVEEAPIKNQSTIVIPAVEKTEKIEKAEKIEKKTETPIIQKPVEDKPFVQDSEEKIRVEAFYQPIREKIYSNINNSIDKSMVKNGEFINIKLTVLKDGRYEQLTFVDGNKEYFELVKPSITKVFPIQIEDSVKNSFPRYFRMKIEF